MLIRLRRVGLGCDDVELVKGLATEDGLTTEMAIYVLCTEYGCLCLHLQGKDSRGGKEPGTDPGRERVKYASFIYG